MTTSIRFLVLFIALLACPFGAQAETVVVAPPEVEAGVNPLFLQATLGRLREWAQSRGDSVMAIAPVDAEEAGLPVPCPDTSCGVRYLSYYEVSSLLQVQIFAPRKSAGGTDGTVAIALLQAPRARFQTTAAIEGDAGDAAERALATLSDALARGAGPWLEVVGTPVGAAVTVNGRAVGALPYYGKPGVGELIVEVSSEGHQVLNTTVFVRDAAEGFHKLEVALQPGVTPELPPVAAVQDQEPVGVGVEPAPGRRHWGDWLVGAGLLAAGVAPVALAANQYAQSGECAGLAEPSGHCDVVSPNGLTAVAMVGGLLTLGGGVLWIARAPIGNKWTAAASSTSAAVFYTERF